MIKIYDLLGRENIRYIEAIGIGFSLDKDVTLMRKWYKIRELRTGKWMRSGGELTDIESKGKEWKKGHHAACAIDVCIKNCQYVFPPHSKFEIIEYCI